MHPRTFWKHFSLVLKKVGLKSFKCHIMHSGLWGDEKYGLHKKQRYLFTIFRRVYVCINWSTILIQCFWRNYSIKNIANPKTRGPSLKVLGNFFANLSGFFLLVLISCCCFLFVWYFKEELWFQKIVEGNC